MTLYPLLGFFALLNNYGLSNFNFHNLKILIPSFTLVAFIVCGYILAYLGMYSVKKTTELRKNVEILTIQLELQQQNYKLINESIEKTRAFEHDIRHHISAVKAMLSKDNIHEALDYVEKLDSQQIDNKLPMICKNFTIDSLLKYYMSRCKASNIDFKAKMNIPEELKIDDLDISIVLGNCIENAIEACEKMNQTEGRFIALGSGIFGENLVFKMKNSFNGQIVKVDNRIRSSKGDRLGIGLSSVNQIISKYNGVFEINYTEDVFEVRMVL